jgi:hypothetical protein
VEKSKSRVGDPIAFAIWMVAYACVLAIVLAPQGMIGTDNQIEVHASTAP